MSDIDPELPDYLVDAILSEGPGPAAVDLVKNAFTWRTVDAELMDLTYDSVLDDAGVRDAGDRRTIEFAAGEISVVIETDGESIRGRLSGLAATEVIAHTLTGQRSVAVESGGSFSFTDFPPGSVSLEFATPPRSIRTPAFVVG